MFWKSGLLPLLFLFFCASSFSQITITQNDVQLMNAVGTSSVSSLDTLTASVDIGNTGSSSWNFSSLVSALEFTSTSIDPSSCPYSGNFPGATLCKHYVSELLGYQADNWLFNSINSSGFFLDGIVTSMDIAGFTMVTTITYTSPEEQLMFPLTYGTTWTQDYSYTTETSTGQSTSQSLRTINTVDAYGTIVLPGGQSEPGLRMKRDERATSGAYYRNISYIFYTQSGNAVSVSIADTASPDHGVVNVNGAGWVIGNITGVEESGSGVPENFELSQNYPNPFNPATIINYKLSSGDFVKLRVYNSLGEQVAELVNEYKPAGVYSIEFNAATLPSGIYIYKLDAGPFSDTGKMALLK